MRLLESVERRRNSVETLSERLVVRIAFDNWIGFIPHKCLP